MFISIDMNANDILNLLVKNVACVTYTYVYYLKLSSRQFGKQNGYQVFLYTWSSVALVCVR